MGVNNYLIQSVVYNNSIETKNVVITKGETRTAHIYYLFMVNIYSLNNPFYKIQLKLNLINMIDGFLISQKFIKNA